MDDTASDILTHSRSTCLKTFRHLRTGVVCSYRSITMTIKSLLRGHLLDFSASNLRLRPHQRLTRLNLCGHKVTNGIKEKNKNIVEDLLLLVRYVKYLEPSGLKQLFEKRNIMWGQPDLLFVQDQQCVFGISELFFIIWNVCEVPVFVRQCGNINPST